MLKSLCGKCRIFVGHGFTVCGKTRFWCHSERSEESLFDLSPMHREILRFAPNDKRTFSAASSAVPYRIENECGFKPLPSLRASYHTGSEASSTGPALPQTVS